MVWQKKNRVSCDKSRRNGLRIFCDFSEWLGEQKSLRLKSLRTTFTKIKTEFVLAKGTKSPATKAADKVLESFVISASGLGGKKASHLKPKHKAKFWRAQKEEQPKRCFGVLKQSIHVRAAEEARVCFMGANTRVLLIPPPSSRAEVATRWVRESPNRGKWPAQHDYLKNMKPKSKVFRKQKGTSVACLCSGTA